MRDERLIDSLMQFHTKQFGLGTSSKIFFCPGRVNLIGDHIDYLGGTVLPFAIQKGIYAVFETRKDDKISINSFDLSETVHVRWGELSRVQASSMRKWYNYILATLALFKHQRKIESAGFNLSLASNLPKSSGLSSSAAICLLILNILSYNSKFKMGKIDMAKMAQKVEHDYMNVPCGIMDQLAINCSKANMLTEINCRTLRVTHHNISALPYSIMVLNTNALRNLADGDYKMSVKECQHAIGLLEFEPNCFFEKERILDLNRLKSIKHQQRIRHVVSEQKRVEQAIAAIKSEDWILLGAYLNKSHESLKQDFEVSGPYLDSMVEIAQSHKACIGARMTGAGFGGCAIALIDVQKKDNFITHVSNKYLDATGIKAQLFEVFPVDGLAISNKSNFI